VIGTNKQDSKDTVAKLLEDAAARRLNEPSSDDIEELLPEHTVLWDGWQAIDAAETAAAEGTERPRVKRADWDALREASGGRGDSQIVAVAFLTTPVARLVDSRWRDVDLAGGRIYVRASKTAAGVRMVDLQPELREDLVAWKARSSHVAAGDLISRPPPETRAIATTSAVASCCGRRIWGVRGGSKLDTSHCPTACRRTCCAGRSPRGSWPSVKTRRM
jgi:integrase